MEDSKAVNKSNKIILTGIKPTGEPHLGNYIGAIRPAIDSINEQTECFYFIADYHAVTSIHDGKKIKDYVREIAAAWLACGLDPDRTWFYRQSDIPEIFELSWILTCHIPKGDLNRAHAYKAAMQANQEAGKEDLDHGINAGLFNYPVLMAADILCFDSDFVPVGKDQVQHIEMARSMAQRVNHYYGDCLKLPKEKLEEDSQSILGLDGRKMSKSYDNTIPIFCREKRLKKLINRITTDSTPPEDPKDPDNSTIFDLYKLFASAKEIEDLASQYRRGISWGEAKAQLFEVVNRELTPFREKYDELMENPKVIDEILEKGALKARGRAKIVLERVKTRVLGRNL